MLKKVRFCPVIIQPMELEAALDLVNEAMVTRFGKPLSDVEAAVFRGAWQRQTYEQIAETSGYSISYIRKHVGAKFWKDLSQALAEPVSKTNFRVAIERRWRSAVLEAPVAKRETQASQTDPDLALLPIDNAPSPTGHTDWGEAVDVSIFYGRTEELDTLSQWITVDRCRLVALLGMGGMGKSSLAAKIAQILQNQFDRVIWRSLRNAPPLEVLLAELVPFLSDQQDTQAKLERLLHWLRMHRCLVILDNVETIMQAGNRAGYYKCDYENYGELLRLLGETAHQSCIILTSREKPAEIAVMESVDAWVRSLALSGSQEATLALINAKGLRGTDAEKQQLCAHYSYSPLALKIVASSISSLFEGEIAAFLKEEILVFNGLRHLLGQQFERLSDLEQTIMYWLAINREWVSTAELMEDIVPRVSRASLLESLESLVWRSLVERKSGRYTQQPVVMEYVSERLTAEVASELITQKLSRFPRHALIKTTVKDYIRDSQVQLILTPVIQQLQEKFHQADALENHLKDLILHLRNQLNLDAGYAIGNIINLYIYLNFDLTGYDFSGFTIRHPYLQNANLHRVNFSNAIFAHPYFLQIGNIVRALAISPQGDLLATGEHSGNIRLWQLSDFQPILVVKGHYSWVTSVAFSPNGRILASSSSDFAIKLWDVQSGQLIRTLRSSNLVFSVAFNPAGTVLASGGGDHRVTIWNLQTGAAVRQLEGHTNLIWSVAFSPDGTLLASVSDDQTVRVWNVTTGQLLSTLQGHESWVMAVAFSPDGTLIATGGSDRTVKLWELATGKVKHTLQGHTSWISSLCFSPTQDVLLSSGNDCDLRLWHIHSGQLQKTLAGHTNLVWSVAFSPEGDLFASGGEDKTVRLWDAQTGQLLKTIQGHSNLSKCVAFSPNGCLLASGNDDHTIKLWDVQTGKLLKTLYGHTDWIASIDFSPDGCLLASGGDSDINLWDVQTGKRLTTLQGHTYLVWTVAFSPDGTLLATGGEDRMIKLWDVRSGRLLKILEGHTNWVTSVTFSPNGVLLASGSGDQTVKVWNVATGDLLRTLAHHQAPVWQVRFRPDQITLISAGDDFEIHYWDINQGVLSNISNTNRGLSKEVSSIALSSDGSQFACGSDDYSIKVKAIGTETENHLTLTGHSDRILMVVFNLNHRVLASSSADGTIRLWNLRSGTCLQTLRSDRPYEGMNITGIKGITDAQKATLKVLGAID